MAETDNNNIVTNEEDLLTQREREWNEVEDLILIYQKQFISDDEETLIASKEAADELLERFSPLFKKWLFSSSSLSAIRVVFEQTQGCGERQGSLACCSPWSPKESDTT